MLCIQPSLVALEAIGDDHAFLVEVVQGRPVMRLLRAAGKRDILAARVAGVRKRTLPVRVGSTIERQLAGRKVAGFHLIRHEGAVLVAAEEIETPCGVCRSDVGIVVERRSAATSAFRLDQDDSVGSAATIDGRGRCVLEDGHRFDVVRIDRIERVAVEGRVDARRRRTGHARLVLQRHAVDDVERVVAGLDRRAATDTHLRSAARLAVVRGDLHAGHAPLEQLLGVRDDTDVGLVGTDRRHRAGDGFSTLGSVSGDDDVTQHGRLRSHRDLDVDRSSRRDGHTHRARREADAGCSHLMDACADEADGERSIAPGQRSVRGTHNAYADCGQGLPRRRVDNAPRDDPRRALRGEG